MCQDRFWSRHCRRHHTVCTLYFLIEDLSLAYTTYLARWLGYSSILTFITVQWGTSAGHDSFSGFPGTASSLDCLYLQVHWIAWNCEFFGLSWSISWLDAGLPWSASWLSYLDLRVHSITWIYDFTGLPGSVSSLDYLDLRVHWIAWICDFTG